MIENLLFVEHYTYADRGGQNITLAIEGTANLYRFYERHFEALWNEAKPL
jgi:histidyl-tRNA synthetase